MAIRTAHSVRSLIGAIAISAAAITVAPALAGAAPSTHPKSNPSVASVQKQLGALARKNSQLVEKFDHAQVLVKQREKQALVAQQTARRAEAAYQAAHDRFRVVIQAQYESGGFGSAAALLDSNSDANYLDRLETLSVASQHLGQIVKDVTGTRDAARSASHDAATALADARKQRDVVAAARKDVQGQIRKYQVLLATLTAAQQAAYRQQTYGAVATTAVKTGTLANLPAAPNPRAAAAVDYALAQVGKPYVFGAAGPSAFDCSGLTMMAWQQGHVSLPHSAADQYNYGHHVAESALEPGDLVFFYQPIGHVTIYIGNGLMVSAPTEGEPVQVVPLNNFTSDYAGATRLVG